MRLPYVVVAASLLASAIALAQTPVPPPVEAVVDGRFPIGDAQLPVFVSQDWSKPLPAIRRYARHAVFQYRADIARQEAAGVFA